METLGVDIHSVLGYTDNVIGTFANQLHIPLVVALQETLHLRFAEELRPIRGRVRRQPGGGCEYAMRNCRQ